METSEWKYSNRKWITNDWGRFALIAILVGGTAGQLNLHPVIQLFLDVVIVAGVVCGIIWYRKRFFQDHD